MLIRSIRALAMLALPLLALPMLALPIAFQPGFAEPEQVPWPVTLRSDLARLGALEFALRTAAGNLCQTRNTASGITLDQIDAYAPAQRELVSHATGLGQAPQVIAVAPDSPAARAGVRVGDDIVAVNGVKIAEIAAAGADKGLLSDAVEDRIAGTPEGREIFLEVVRSGTPLAFRFAGRPLCATRVYLKTDEGMDAYSDTHNIAIGARFFNFARNDDELALLVGHEMAHVVAGDDKAGNIRTRRAMEDRADLLGADLARCAGYDMTNGLGLWRRYDEGDWLRWFREPTHRRMSERIRRISDHLARTPNACPTAVPALSFD